MTETILKVSFVMIANEIVNQCTESNKLVDTIISEITNRCSYVVYNQNKIDIVYESQTFNKKLHTTLLH